MSGAKIVVGLGNPGRAYRFTPHNAGFMVIDELAERCGCRLRHSLRAHAKLAKAVLADKEAWLVRPETFMNNSGVAVNAMFRKTGASPEELIVVVDDADIEFGRLRIRSGGGNGGHNGLKSIIASIGADSFIRVRIGIGRGAQGGSLMSHVLAPLNMSAREEMNVITSRAADAVMLVIEKGVETAMNRFNTRETGRDS